MANRFPLIVDSSALQIKEIEANDNLDLANNSIVNVVDITVSGNVTIGGTLTYEDVKNIDSVGLITARTGIKIGPSAGVAGTFFADGSYVTAGIITAGSFIGSGSGLTGAGSTVADDATTDASFFPVFTQTTSGDIRASKVSTTKLSFNPSSGILSTTSLYSTGTSTFSGGLNTQDLLTEEVNVTAGKLSDNLNIDLESGMVHLFTTQETTTSTPNIRYNASTSLNSKMSVGQSAAITLITTAAAAAYSNNITIDGNAVTENWIGGTPPTSGGDSGVDTHAFTIIKTGDNVYTVIGNHNVTS